MVKTYLAQARPWVQTLAVEGRRETRKKKRRIVKLCMTRQQVVSALKNTCHTSLAVNLISKTHTDVQRGKKWSHSPLPFTETKIHRCAQFFKNIFRNSKVLFSNNNLNKVLRFHIY